MNAQHHAELVRKLSATPARYIESARRQNAPGLGALQDLSIVWGNVPQTLELGIIDMFLSHLRADKAPALTTPPRAWRLDAAFAHVSLVALGGVGLLLDNPMFQEQSRTISNGWQGIFKWCAYIYDARVASESAQDREIFLASIGNVLQALCPLSGLVASMVKTAGCLELVTKLWVLEDAPASIDLGPVSTATLGALISSAALMGRSDTHGRVIRAAGGDAEFIVRLELGRVKKATKAINFDGGALALSWHLNFITALCQIYPHPLRRAFFDADGIAVVTSSFVALSRIVVQNPTPTCISMMTSCFLFFSSYLEGDDYLSLVHAIKAGFLPAFLDCSPVFSQMPQHCVESALDILAKVLPPYLVYLSFFKAVTSALDKLKTPHYQASIVQPMIRTSWSSFVALLEKRRPSFEHVKKLKSEGTPVECAYIKCRLIDVKNSFRRCAACRTATYCSAECQKLAWKSSHRTDCAHMKAEYDGHRDKGRPKTDLAGLHGLAIWVSDVNFAAFHSIAEREFPDTPHEKLMPCIDFRRVPEEYSVKVIEPGASGHPGVYFSPADAAVGEERFQMLVSQWRGTGKTIVQSVIASGATIEILTTPIERKDFWTDKNTYSSDEESDSSDGEAMSLISDLTLNGLD